MLNLYDIAIDSGDFALLERLSRAMNTNIAFPDTDVEMENYYHDGCDYTITYSTILDTYLLIRTESVAVNTEERDGDGDLIFTHHDETHVIAIFVPGVEDAQGLVMYKHIILEGRELESYVLYEFESRVETYRGSRMRMSRVSPLEYFDDEKKCDCCGKFTTVSDLTVEAVKKGIVVIVTCKHCGEDFLV